MKTALRDSYQTLCSVLSTGRAGTKGTKSSCSSLLLVELVELVIVLSDFILSGLLTLWEGTGSSLPSHIPLVTRGVPPGCFQIRPSWQWRWNVTSLPLPSGQRLHTPLSVQGQHLWAPLSYRGPHSTSETWHSFHACPVAVSGFTFLSLPSCTFFLFVLFVFS